MLEYFLEFFNYYFRQGLAIYPRLALSTCLHGPELYYPRPEYDLSNIEMIKCQTPLQGEKARVGWPRARVWTLVCVLIDSSLTVLQATPVDSYHLITTQKTPSFASSNPDLPQAQCPLPLEDFQKWAENRLLPRIPVEWNQTGTTSSLWIWQTILGCFCRQGRLSFTGVLWAPSSVWRRHKNSQKLTALCSACSLLYSRPPLQKRNV